MTKTLRSGERREYHVRSRTVDNNLAKMILVQADLMAGYSISLVIQRYGLGPTTNGITRGFNLWRDELEAARYLVGGTWTRPKKKEWAFHMRRLMMASDQPRLNTQPKAAPESKAAPEPKAAPITELVPELALELAPESAPKLEPEAEYMRYLRI